MEFSLDASSLEEMTRKLVRAATKGERAMDVALATIGAEHKALAKTIASAHSTSIPPTIRMEPGRGEVKLIAGSEDVPLAILYEKGNRKKGGGRDSQRSMITGMRTKRGGAHAGMLIVDTAKSFAHPVFGDDNDWVDQARYPFFAPARTQLRRRTDVTLASSWKRALQSSGIKVS